MSPEDPRHGKNSGYIAGCREGCCRKAHMREIKAWRLTGPRMVNSLGTRRRVEALEAIGWSRAQQSRMLGHAREYLGQVTRLEMIHRSTAEAVADLYDRYSMVIPTDPPERKQGANRIHEKTRRRAARLGFAPPLAWDNIDDPDEHPTGWKYRDPSRADLLTDLADQGAGISRACAALKLSPASLQKWCERHDMTDVYARLKSREDGIREYRNQWTADQHERRASA
jgi:hypothetical protein